jgi:hypothetical protein
MGQGRPTLSLLEFFVPHYPGHSVYLDEAAAQLGVTDRGILDQAKALPPLSRLSCLVGQAYEASRQPHHAQVDLVVARKQAVILEAALLAAKAILNKAVADLADKPEPTPAPDTEQRTRRR